MFSKLFSAVAIGMLTYNAMVAAYPSASDNANANLVRRGEDQLSGPNDGLFWKRGEDDDSDDKVMLMFERLFQDIEDIPDVVLHGGDKVAHAWVATHGHRDYGRDKENDNDKEIDRDNKKEAGDHSDSGDKNKHDKRGVLSCIWEVTQFFLSNSPVGRIVRAKTLIRQLGGAAAAARKIWAARNNWRAVGGALRDLIEILTGFGDVREACGF